MSDEQAGDAASAADAELAEDAFNVRADSRDLDLKPVRNLLVAEIVRDHARDFEFTHRKPQYRGAACLRRYRTACGADERTGERRLDQPQQLQRMRIEIAALAAAPDPDIADIAAASEAV